MKKQIEVSPQFIVDPNGKKTAVIIDMITFEKLLDAAEDFYLGSLAEKAITEETDWVTLDDWEKEIRH